MANEILIKTLSENLLATFPAMVEASKGWNLTSTRQNPMGKLTLSLTMTPDLKALDGHVFEAFADALKTYQSLFPLLKTDNDQGYEVLKFRAGESLDERVDTANETISRVVVGLVAIPSAGAEGGALVLPKQNITIPVETGKVILFPCSYAFPYRIDEVKSGCVYYVVTWLY